MLLNHNFEHPVSKFKLSRMFNLVRSFIALMIVLCVTEWAYAQNYPQGPVNVITPWADGFPANSARIYSEELAKRYGQPFVLQSKPGAGGEVAARQVIGSVADGSVLLVTGSSITIRGVSDPKNADGERDLQPIAQLTTTPYVIVAKAGRFGSFKNFLETARNQPGKLEFASAGVGTGMHYLGELMNAGAKINLVHIPYSTGSRQLQAVLAGDVSIAIISLVTALPQIKAGTLEALAVSSTERSRVAPNIPTLVESGLPGIPSMGAWIAMFAPKGVNQNIINSLSEKIASIAKDPSVIERVTSWGAEIPNTSVSHLEQVIRTEKSSWSKLIKEKNLTTNN